jgi:hypothetical protein
MAIAVVAGAIANKPHNGGEAWVRLSWLLGLRRLGWDVWFVERLPSAAPEGQAYFERVVGEFGLEGRVSLLGEGGEPLVGAGEEELGQLAGDAEILFDISGHLGGGPIAEAVPTRVYVDLDPGFTQVWHDDPAIDFSVAGYDRYLTVGQNIGRPGCLIPTGGIEWVPTLPPVLLEEWVPAPRPTGPPRFTTVATWRSPYGGLTIGGRTMKLKHHQFRRFAELPRLVPAARFEIALDIHPGDAADLELLSANGWDPVDPRAAAGTPAAFRDYVRGSGAEFSVAQGVYVETASGWFSDRTAAYLASGRPALVQGTGGRVFFLPTGTQRRHGAVAFDDLDAAVAGAEAIAAGWEEHSRSARELAAEHLDSDRVLTRVLERVLPLLLIAIALCTGAGEAKATGPVPRVEIVGKPQVVFDWSEEACLPGAYPDLPTRAFRDFRGRVQLLLSHYVNYRLIGPSLGRLRPDCEPVMSSPGDPRPSAFADRRWIASIFTRDGRTIWALVHEEYQGNRHRGHCPSGSYERCWYNAVTLARSSDGGRTYRPVHRGPRRLVAVPSFRYRPDVGPRGVFGPSNIVRGSDGAFYALVSVRDLDGRDGVCAIRTERLSAPGGWRAWDGVGFRARFRNPYRSPGRRRIPCALVEPGRIAEMASSLTYNRALGRYLLVGLAPPGPLSLGANVRGIYYATSADLIHWTPRTLIAPAVTKHNHRCGGPPAVAYPSVIDPASRSRTFAVSGKRPFLYYTLLRYENCRLSENRDLLRVRLAISP